MSGVLTHAPLVAPGSIEPGQSAAPTLRVAATPTPVGPSFQELLARHASAPHFSRHALDRLQQRGITLDEPTLGRLTDGIQRAAGKGSRDSVVFVDGTAYVVSVTNNTVITAVGSEHMRQQVFTNIDSAVIA